MPRYDVSVTLSFKAATPKAAGDAAYLYMSAAATVVGNLPQTHIVRDQYGQPVADQPTYCGWYYYPNLAVKEAS